ncbi:aldolase/citrate lyase family protein [Pseudohongiella sp. SYSU M77423]|uniref:HpcH/HpaI aldolase family protein n=1 Tax=Pseudohongiella sp. SYSU M77423 TaxID=3042312 RepID=UPI002480EF2B|nr:aldolase/citrate lyase family protein [Pseudohongiella sp. SYSU M77423]MDH7944549.1 aldolase/citrate lyase family protein [Pseudohongiella sp. SYSU M77423]
MRKTCLSALFSVLTVAGLAATPVLAQDDVRLNRSIQTLENGEPVFGLFTGNFSLANARALARSNLDYILIDMEHTAHDMETLQEFLLGMTDKLSIVRQGNAQMRTTPIVRLPANGRNDPEWLVKQILDIGAFGIMFPYVETGEEALRAVKAMRYPQPRGSEIAEPAGVRGASPAVASWYWGAADYVQRADTWPLNPQGELLAVMQIESVAGVENAEDIITTPGVGAVFVGPADLSMSMGLPGNHPEVQAAIDSVVELCKRHNVPCGITTNASDIQARLDQGFLFPTVGYWGDAGISGSTEANLRIAREHAGRDD